MRSVRISACLGAVALVAAAAGCRGPEQDGAKLPVEEQAHREDSALSAPSAEPGAVASFTLAAPRWGVLHVPLPTGVEARRVDSEIPGGARLRIAGEAPEPYVAYVTVLGVPGMMPGFGDDSWLEEELLRWKDGIAEASAADPVEFRLDGVSGYYLTLEAATHGSGQYPYLLQGFFNADGCIVSYQVLHHASRASVANRYLALLSEADWEAEETHPVP